MDKKTHIIKRYQNRKLYDTSSSCYVTLEDIAKMVKGGEEVKVVDNRNKDDLTAITFAQIIFEQEKKKQSLLPLNELKRIIRDGGGHVVDFVQRTVESGVESFSHARGEAEKYIERLIKKGDISFEEGRNLIKDFIDDKIKSPLSQVSNIPSVQTEIRSLHKKIEILEKKLKEYQK